MLLVNELKKSFVNDHITHNFSVKSGTSIENTFEIMNKNNIGVIAIVDSDNNLKGIFTERNVLNRVINAQISFKEPIERAMIKSASFVESGSFMADCFILMHQHNYRYVPILESQKFKGFIEARSFVQFLSEIFPTAISTVAPDNVPSPDFREGG